MLAVIPGVLAPAELARVRSAIERASFEPGGGTGGHDAQRVKHNLQIPADGDPGQTLAGLVAAALQRNALFMSAALPARTTPPMINRYQPGMAYGAHVDNAVMGGVRSDVAVTLFLSDAASYDGGELTIEDVFGPRSVKLPAGHLVLYPASSLHHVHPVTRGLRDAAIIWVQSLVRSPEQRRLLFDLDMTINGLRNRAPDAPEIVRLNATYHNLLRQWAAA
jgi:PKHD-type hydroxylase